MGESTDIERKVEARLAHRWDWLKVVVSVLAIVGAAFGGASYLFATSRTVDRLEFRITQLEKDFIKQEGDLRKLTEKVDRIDKNVVQVLERLPK